MQIWMLLSSRLVSITDLHSRTRLRLWDLSHVQSMLMHKQQEVLSGSVDSSCAYTRHHICLGADENPKSQLSKAQIHLKGKPGSTRGRSKIQIAKSKPSATIGMASAPPRQREPLSTNALASGDSWDVQGTCQIKCPGVEGGWSLQGDPALTLDI
ncbi:hypothetical protein NA56DRAFT_707889 [Hyaloscypha hepaticicola]|uniref:Uncharacterized protein n=1 Tax=Hyaloscypha hepaticicola TaxID=2082293 RepID=A0A2J6PTQ9_9HELO|nr:hypothetical protein NA56DRAFT_707889 [Hyaloscypha hepaticicola]